MTNKTTKRALLISVVALILCFAMLMGTTYAWFTDSVTSVGNKIEAGTLDVQLWMYNGTEYVDISDEIDLKLKMLECHESQIVWMREHDGIDFPDLVRTCSRYRGYQCGAEYAEGFRQCQVYLKGTTKRLLP